MKALAHTLILIAALSVATVALAQQSSNQQNSGSISGQITIEGKPAPGAVVIVNPSDTVPRPMIYGQDQKPFAKSTTDEEGRFMIKGLAAGTYLVSTASPVFISSSDTLDWRRGKQINLSEGESIDDVNIQLVRGGVITGRVTDFEGRPVTGNRVTLHQLGARNEARPVYLPNTTVLEVDDRGIYRAYGLPPGRYRVSVGIEVRSDMVRGGFGSNFYERTFHPDTTDVSKATIIEVSPGSESTGIDIKVGKPVKAFAASGRVVYADTGQPVEGAMCGYGILMQDGKNVGPSAFSSMSDSTGAFRLQGIVPGKYAATSAIQGESDYYSEPVPFEITSEDISGIEIKLHRGASISGVIVVEGTDDPEVLAKISKLQVFVFSKDGPRGPLSNVTKVAPDGSFRAGGVKPGKVSLIVISYPSQKGFQQLRIERDGVDQSEGIEVTEGAQISGLRVVIAYGTARIRGQVRFESGRLTDGQRLMVATRRLNTPTPQYGPAVEVDQRGRFDLAGLVAGEYELRLFSVVPTPGQRSDLAKQKVTVTDGADIEVTINVDTKANEKEREK